MSIQPKYWDFLIGAFDVPFEVLLLPDRLSWQWCQVVRTIAKDTEKLGLRYERHRCACRFCHVQGEINVIVESHFGRDAFTVSCADSTLKDVSRAELVEVITRFLEPGVPPPAVPRLPPR